MTPTLQGLSIFLIGMMGSGKSTVGQALAYQLHYRFVDTDTLIESIAQQSISEIFQTQGEESFRELESQTLNELAAYLRCVIATGGGAVLNQMNWSYLRQGLVIWLDAPIDLLVERLKCDRTRPLLQTEDLPQKLTTLLEQRSDLYRQADLIIPIKSHQSPDEIAFTIIEKIPSVLRDVPLNEWERDPRSRNN